MDSSKELNKKSYSRKKADRRSNNVYKSRSAGSLHLSRGKFRIYDRNYHHARRGVINSLIKSDNVEELVDTDLKYKMNEHKWCTTSYNKTENLFRDNDKKFSNKQEWLRRRNQCVNGNSEKKMNKIDKFLFKFGVKYDYRLDQSMQPRYVADNNLLNTHLEYYIQSKAKSVELPIKIGDVTKLCNEGGYNVLEINACNKSDERYNLAYAAITTIYPFKPDITYYWRSSLHYIKRMLMPSYVDKDIKRKGYSIAYLWIKVKLFGNTLYEAPLFNVYIDKNMKDFTYYFVGSEGGALAYCKGYDIKEAKQKDFMEDDHSGEPKIQDHYEGKTVERNTLDDDDDKTSYEMGKLIFSNLVKKI